MYILHFILFSSTYTFLNLYFRSKFIDVIKSTLLKIPNLSSSWLENGRVCSPRMLFYFETCPNEFKKTKQVKY